MTPAANSWVMDAPPLDCTERSWHLLRMSFYIADGRLGNSRAARWLARDRAGGR